MFGSQDAPVTKDILGVCFEILEEQWEVYVENRNMVGKKKTALMGCMLVSGYYGALRGEEVNRVREHTSGEEEMRPPYFSWYIQAKNWNKILHSTTGMGNQGETNISNLVCTGKRLLCRGRNYYRTYVQEHIENDQDVSGGNGYRIPRTVAKCSEEVSQFNRRWGKH